jgi:hypothetical protein
MSRRRGKRRTMDFWIPPRVEIHSVEAEVFQKLYQAKTKEDCESIWRQMCAKHGRLGQNAETLSQFLKRCGAQQIAGHWYA